MAAKWNFTQAKLNIGTISLLLLLFLIKNNDLFCSKMYIEIISSIYRTNFDRKRSKISHTHTFVFISKTSDVECRVHSRGDGFLVSDDFYLIFFLFILIEIFAAAFACSIPCSHSSKRKFQVSFKVYF